MAASVTITSVQWNGTSIGLHGTVNGQPIDTYPPNTASLAAFPSTVQQRRWVAEQLVTAASSYPVASALPLTIGASGSLII